MMVIANFISIWLLGLTFDGLKEKETGCSPKHLLYSLGLLRSEEVKGECPATAFRDEKMSPHQEKYVSRPLRKVLNGQFPVQDVKKMNVKTLENFVLKLIQHSMVDGAKTNKSFISVCNDFNSKQISKPAWWPSDKILGPDFPSNSNILLTNRLKLLVLKCAEFFRNSCDNFVKELYIDENNVNLNQQEIEVVRRSLRVQSLSKDTEQPITKKQKTLSLKNSTPPLTEVKASCQRQTMVLSSPTIDISTEIFNTEVEICYKRQTIIPLTDVLKTKVIEESQDQTSFLGNLFGLSKNEQRDDSKNEKLIIPSYNHHVIKLTNSHNIPFSSDIGKMLIERDAHCFPESLRARKCERLEWYVNKNPQRAVEVKYEVSYQETKKDTSYNNSCHIFKFPKRQFCQYQYPTKFQLEVCKLLKVMIRRDNLEDLKMAWKTPRMLQIVLPKMIRVKTEKVTTCHPNKGFNVLRLQRLAPRISLTSIKKGVKLEQIEKVLTKKLDAQKVLIPNPCNKKIKKEMVPGPVKSELSTNSKIIKFKVQKLCEVKTQKYLQKVQIRCNRQTLNKVPFLSKTKKAYGVQNNIKVQKFRPSRSMQIKVQEINVKPTSIKTKSEKSKSPMQLENKRKVQNLTTQSQEKFTNKNKKTQLKVQKNKASLKSRVQLQSNIKVQKLKNQSKCKAVNTKIKNILQEQKSKTAKFKVQGSLKEKLERIKKSKDQCPNQGKPQTQHKPVLHKQQPSKIRHKEKRK